jgi:hypothetical protein
MLLAEAAVAQTTLAGPTGAAGAYRRRAWNDVGGLDEGVVLYAEDVDLALQLRASGWSTTTAPDAVAIHIGSAVATRRSAWQRYQGGFSRGYFLRRYRSLGARARARALVTEFIVVVADVAVFSTTSRPFAGEWRDGGQRRERPKAATTWEAIDCRITFGTVYVSGSRCSPALIRFRRRRTPNLS